MRRLRFILLSLVSASLGLTGCRSTPGPAVMPTHPPTTSPPQSAPAPTLTPEQIAETVEPTKSPEPTLLWPYKIIAVVAWPWPNPGGTLPFQVLVIDLSVFQAIASPIEGLSVGNKVSWDARGERIVFSGAGPLQLEVGTTLFILDITRDSLQPVHLDLVGTIGWWYPDWSPDGERIAFSQTGSPDRMHIVMVGEREPRFVTYGTEASWSPDGRRLAFVLRWEHMVYGDLYVVDASGENLTQLTTGMAVSSPDWSPNGEWIAFVGRQVQETDEKGDKGIFLIRPDGSDLTLLEPGLVPAVSWTPDGCCLVFAAPAPDSQRNTLYLLSVQDGRRQEVQGLPGTLDYFYGAFQPIGR